MNTEKITAQVYGDATPDQIAAIAHYGSHARLLAGPGTGKTKTITRRVLALVLLHGVEPESILLLTFTRLAAAQLREEIRKALEPHGKGLPCVSTLHSFALKQILTNGSRVDTLPRPVRIADDWEERNIIQEDLKLILGLEKIDDVQKLIQQLATDWETLRADETGWEKQFPDAHFLGAWRKHREIYGETLRAELVYQLKKQLEANRDFKLDRGYRHVLIDEFQDLNSCDLAIVRHLSEREAEIFAVGDDDQSIYGFRFADPYGIRNFPEQYPDCKRLALEICFRCDQDILKHAEFIADLDVKRLPKGTRARDGAGQGEVVLMNFRDQAQEASTLATEVKGIIDSGAAPEKIVLLLRSDKNGAMSKPIIAAFEAAGVQVSKATEDSLDEDKDYRTVLSALRLVAEPTDCLAWRSLFQLAHNRVGTTAIKAVWDYAAANGKNFCQAIETIVSDTTAIESRYGDPIRAYYSSTKEKLDTLGKESPVSEVVEVVMTQFVDDEDKRAFLQSHFDALIQSLGAEKIADLLSGLNVVGEGIEQETENGKVNILTMHQAKGLTFDYCYIIAVEDEMIPGRNEGAKEDDERRLLYVSMTRARNRLVMTYCSKRTGEQAYYGRTSGASRSLTRFLRDAPLTPKRM